MEKRVLFYLLALITFVFIIWNLWDVQVNLNGSIFTIQSRNFTRDDPLNEYFKIHTQISNDKNVTSRKIFFTYSTDGGYGNRMYAVISSTLIAILLKCQLVNKWSTKEHLCIDPPINIFDPVNMPDGFNLTGNVTYLNFTYFFPHPKYPFAINKNIADLIENPYYIPENYTRYGYGSGRPLFTELSANIRFYDQFEYYNLARKKTLDLANEALRNYKNFSNTELQKRVLNVAFEIGGNILNRIYRPNQYMLNLIDYYVEKYFKNSFVIGLQMRAADSGYLDETKDHLKFISCALEIEKEFLIRNKILEVSFKWFIATDSDKMRNYIFDNYPEKSFSSNGTVGHSGWSNIEQFKKTILDVELLSRCDEIITTGASTFGWLAAMKSLKMPYYVTGFSMNKCLRADLGKQPANQHGTGMFRK